MRFPTRCLLPLLLVTVPVFAQKDLPERQVILQLVSEGKHAEALAEAREWTLANPSSPEALLLYSTLQESADDITGCLDSLDSAYFLTRDVSILVRKGYVYMRSSQFDAAQRQFRQALRQHETYAPAHVGLALIMMEQKDLDEAAAAARAALAIDPNSAEALVALGRLEITNGRWAAAETFLQQALGVRPDYPEAHLWLGRAHSDAHREAMARDEWQRYVALEPASAEAWLLSQGLYPTRSRPYPCTGYYPAFAPDGRQLAYRGRGDAGAVYLTTVDAPDKGERIYQSDATLYTVDWSPDSKYLLCRDYTQEQVDGKPQYKYRLIVIEARFGGKATILYEGRYVGQPSWGPGGQTVHFDGYTPTKTRAILSVPLTGGEPTIALTPANTESFVSCQWLPDGKQVVLQRWSAKDREYQLVLSDPMDRKQDRILTRAQQSLYYVTVSPGAKYLLYYRRLGQPPMWTLMALSLESPGPAHPVGVRSASLLPPALTADLKHLLMWVGSGMQLYDLAGIH